MTEWCIWTLSWYSPYSEPPDGLPRKRIELAYPDTDPHFDTRNAPPEIESLWCPGDGWIIGFGILDDPPRQISREGRASIRKKNLRRRIESKFPMFADQFIDEAISKKPDYFDGKLDERAEQARQELFQGMRDRKARLIKEYYARQAESPKQYDLTINRWRKFQVEAESVDDFLKRFCKHYSPKMVKMYEHTLNRDGVCFVSFIDSTTGKTVAYFGLDHK